MKAQRTLEERFWKKVDKRGPDECWPFRTKHGYARRYGQISEGPKGAAKTYKSHRLAWQFSNGAIPPGLFVCHACDNPPCCNPAHLFLGTSLDNQRDAMHKGRLVSGERHHFHRSHGPVAPRGENHWRTKLTVQQAQEIKERRAAGETCRALAREYGVHNKTISRIARGLTGLG